MAHTKESLIQWGEKAKPKDQVQVHPNTARSLRVTRGTMNDNEWNPIGTYWLRSEKGYKFWLMRSADGAYWARCSNGL